MKSGNVPLKNATMGQEITHVVKKIDEETRPLTRKNFRRSTRLRPQHANYKSALLPHPEVGQIWPDAWFLLVILFRCSWLTGTHSVLQLVYFFWLSIFPLPCYGMSAFSKRSKLCIPWHYLRPIAFHFISIHFFHIHNIHTALSHHCIFFCFLFFFFCISAPRHSKFASWFLTRFLHQNLPSVAVASPPRSRSHHTEPPSCHRMWRFVAGVQRWRGGWCNTLQRQESI